jgi:hypothetical protein
MSKLLQFAKAHVALVGAALTWYVAHYPSGQWTVYASAALAVLTALGVLVTPNRKPAPKVVESARPPKRVVVGQNTANPTRAAFTPTHPRPARKVPARKKAAAKKAKP